ncbi:MAG: ATP-binding domain-containing protein [Xanthomonadales bacterium]|nr:ATP-binding domain-containing protein [Xanthomonadales bacterium]
MLRDALRADAYFNALRVKFGYALTCHKAQGSEWESAFVSCRMGGMSMSSEAYFRWIYTAITRAKGKLHLLGAPRFTPWSDIEEPADPAQVPRPNGDECEKQDLSNASTLR